MNETKRTTMKKTWTGNTARRELFLFVTNKANLTDLTISWALEYVLEGADKAKEGSLKRLMSDWWDGASGAAQERFLGECRTEVRKMDRLEGRVVAR